MKNINIDYLSESVTLPDIPALKERLAGKLEEYKKRIERYKREYAVNSVGVVLDRNGNLLDAIYKSSIVEALLKHGKVNIGELREKLKRDFNGYILDDQFTNAVSVIDDYLRTGGLHTKGTSKFFNADMFESMLGKAGKIELPADPTIVSRLRKKYHEYLGRIVDHQRSVDRTVDLGAMKRDRYKTRIIDELQEHKRVDLHDLIEKLVKEEGGTFDRLEFYMASARIHQLLDPNYLEGSEDTTVH